MSDILFSTFSDDSIRLPFQLHGLGMNHLQEPIDRPRGLAAYQWIQCLQGSGVLYMNNTQYTVRPGQGMFLYPSQPHAYQADHPDTPWIVHFICFKGSGVAPLLEQTQLSCSGVFNLNEPDAISGRLKEIYDNAPAAPLLAHMRQSGQLYDIILQLILHTTAESGISLSIQNQRIAPVITYIQQHYAEPLFLDTMAGLCGLSEEYLCQLFKKYTGMRIFEYIQQTRIQHSKELLLEMPELPVHTIGKLCGFNSSSYYNKIFKKLEHLSPQEFRRQNGIRRRRQDLGV